MVREIVRDGKGDSETGITQVKSVSQLWGMIPHS